jgi:hypothetical protein
MVTAITAADMVGLALGGGLCPPSDPSPQDFVAPAKPALEQRVTGASFAGAGSSEW